MSSNDILSRKKICVCDDCCDSVADDDQHNGALRGVAKVSRVWPTGQVIRIHFINGTVEQRQFVRKTATKWLLYINLDFQWDVAAVDSHVRIGFDKGGSWSHIGTSNLNIAKTKKTMNFGWMPANPSSDKDAGVVLHEFGHMLGMAHEHQSPRNKVTWIPEKIIADLSLPPNSWSESQIRRNVLSRLQDGDNVVTTDSFDTKSIMTYPFPADWNEEGVSVSQPNSLSSADKDFIQRLYPFSEIEGGQKLKWKRKFSQWFQLFGCVSA